VNVTEMLRAKEHMKKLKRFCNEYYVKYRRLPTYKEISDFLGIKSKKQIWTYLNRLKEQGEIPNINYRPILTNAERFCMKLKMNGVNKISLFELSDAYLKEYIYDDKTNIAELYGAAIGVGIEVTDCAWSRD